MSDFDELVKKLHSLKPELSLVDIGKRVEQKKQKIGAGYLTDQGALYLVASDLGVKLDEVIDKSKKIEESKSSKKIQKKQEPSISTNPQDLERKFNSISNIKKKSSMHNRIGVILILFGIIWLVITISFELVLMPPLELQIALFILAPIGFSILILKRATKFSLTFAQDFFHTVYKIDADLQTYVDLKTDQSKEKSIKSIRNLADDFAMWSHFGPIFLYSTPYSIFENLTGVVIPLVKEEKFKDIESFRTTLFNFILRINVHTLVMEDLEYLKTGLETLPKISKVTKEEKKSQSTLQKYPQLKFIWISPLVGGLIFLVFNSIDSTQIHASLGYSLTIGLGILIAIFTLVKRKQFG